MEYKAKKNHELIKNLTKNFKKEKQKKSFIS